MQCLVVVLGYRYVGAVFSWSGPRSVLLMLLMKGLEYGLQG